MGNHYESNGNGYLPDPSTLQIIRHPSYNLSWLDIRVFYVRISNFTVDDSTPECLTLNHIPLSPDTVLEVNGIRCSTDSEGISCILHMNRVDKKSEEATFVSTDSVRLMGNVRFEVFDAKDFLIYGVLEICNSNCFIGESSNVEKRWIMDCESVNSKGTGFLKCEQMMGSESSSPTIEVYVAGCFSGTPIILTKTLQLNYRKRYRKGMLDSIPEYDASESHEDVASRHDLQVTEYRNYKPESEEDYDDDNNLYWGQTEYTEVEDGELSWFNAGVRVGVGIGLGICLGIGIGVGLIVRTYQTTTRTFKRMLV